VRCWRSSEDEKADNMSTDIDLVQDTDGVYRERKLVDRKPAEKKNNINVNLHPVNTSQVPSRAKSPGAYYPPWLHAALLGARYANTFIYTITSGIKK
jgi:hypothetical protein